MTPLDDVAETCGASRKIIASALSVCLFVLIAITGCGSRNSAAASSPEVARAQTASRQQAEQFMAALESMPQDKRRQYVGMHPEMVQTLSASGDPKMMPRFTELMKDAGAH